jgi:hypothetical protein
MLRCIRAAYVKGIVLYSVMSLFRVDIYIDCQVCFTAKKRYSCCWHGDNAFVLQQRSSVLLHRLQLRLMLQVFNLSPSPTEVQCFISRRWQNNYEAKDNDSVVSLPCL